MSVLLSFTLLLSIFLQYEGVSNFPSGTFTDKEAVKFEKESDDIDGRIDVYRNASIRIQKELKKAVSEEGFQNIPNHIQLWTSLVTESLKDIEVNINPKKKKSKALIKYEIQVRKTINDLRELQIRAPYDQQDIFDNCLNRADTARGKMVDILFQPEKVSEVEVDE